MDLRRGRSKLTSGVTAEFHRSHMTNMSLLASCTEAGYPRCRPAIAASLPAQTLGRPPILLVDDGSPYDGESRRSPLQTQWWDSRVQRIG
jgi:hypothetical protein